MHRKVLIGSLRLVKKLMPIKVRVLLRPLEELAQTLIFGRQHLMVLKPSKKLPELALNNGVTITSFKEYDDEDAWVGLVNGILGEWDRKSADAFFFGEKHFTPELCLFILYKGRLAGTACGRIIEKKGKRTGEVHMVAVLPEFRGMGLGYSVTLALLQQLRERFDGDIILRTDLWRTSAVKVYEKLGFTVHREV